MARLWFDYGCVKNYLGIVYEAKSDQELSRNILVVADLRSVWENLTNGILKENE